VLKISEKEGAGGRKVLLVEGTLGGAWVGELGEACRALLHDRGGISLDLSGVVFVDRAGAELLETLTADPRVEIEGASSFVVELLKGGAA
jgi:hypothetical protein